MTVQMQMDIARYSKLIFMKDTEHNEEREAKLLERCPPGHEGKSWSMNLPQSSMHPVPSSHGTSQMP
jgi:hypothetical protein